MTKLKLLEKNYLENNVYYIYEIKNLINGKTYIGQRKCPNNISPLDDRYMGSGVLINKAIKKYGLKNFIKTIIESNILTRKEADDREIYWIEKNWENGKGEYNIVKGGNTLPSLKEVSLEKQIEWKKHMSEAHKGLFHTEEEKQKIRLGNLGRVISEETKRKISEANKGNKYFLGKTHSEETRRKISEAHKGKKLSEEHKEKDRLAQLGRKHSEETRRKISEANKGRVISEETRRKISEAHKNMVISEETRKRMSEVRKGIVFSEEHKRRLSESCKNRVISEETKRKISEANKGRAPSKGSKGMHWFNNGEISVFAYVCPIGFEKGRLIKKVNDGAECNEEQVASIRRELGF